MQRALPWLVVALVVAAQAVLFTRHRPRPNAGEASAPPDARVEALIDRVAALERTVGELQELRSTPTRERAPANGVAGGDAAPAERDALAVLTARLEALEEGAEEARRNGSREAVRALTDALLQGDELAVGRLLAQGVDPNGRDDDRNTPLGAAAKAGSAAMIDLLVANGASLERRSGRRDMTPLLVALDAGQEEAALHLLDLGSSGRAVDKNGESALMWAAFNGASRVAERLVADGIDPNPQSHEGMSALTDAVRRGYPDIARVLLEAGADPNVRTKAGESPLDFAGADAELIALLREYGAQDG